MNIGMNMLLWTGNVTEKHLPLFTALRAAGFDGVEIPAFDVSDPLHYRFIGRAAHVPSLSAATRVWRSLFDDAADVYLEGIELIRNAWNGGIT
jgi:hypothetical protein